MKPYHGIRKPTTYVNKLVFIISRFSRLKHIIPFHMFMLIYSSIIQQKFDYAITIWGYTCDNNLHKIKRLQNRAARIVTGNYDYVTTRGMAPAYLCNEITLHSEIAERTTRSVNDNNVFVQHAHLESFKNNFTHRRPMVCNSLPDYHKTCGTLHSFKAKMKLYIMN